MNESFGTGPLIEERQGFDPEYDHEREGLFSREGIEVLGMEVLGVEQGAPASETGETIGIPHLNADIPPIMACTGLPHMFEEDLKKFRTKNSDRVLNVKWGSVTDEHERLGIVHGGTDSYVISPIDSRDKMSKDFGPCLGMVLIGKEKETGKNVSAVAHMFPGSPQFFSPEFADHMQGTVSEMKEKCDEGTIDAIMFGGWDDESSLDDPGRPKEYKTGIERCSEVARAALGFAPAVISGGKKNFHFEDAFVDTEHRRLFLERNR